MGQVKISHSRFTQCKDKCISSGEGSRAKLQNIIIRNCDTGVAIKDTSQVSLLGESIAECRIGINAFRKKWRWKTGGNGKIRVTLFLNSREADIAGDKHSHMMLDSSLKHKIKTKGKFKLDYLETT